MVAPVGPDLNSLIADMQTATYARGTYENGKMHIIKNFDDLNPMNLSVHRKGPDSYSAAIPKEEYEKDKKQIPAKELREKVNEQEQNNLFDLCTWN